MRSILFEPSKINGMQLINRFIRSATWEGMASKEGAYTQRLVELMTQLAKGAVGLIVTGHAYVGQDGQAGPWQLGIYKDELVQGLREITRNAHIHGTRIVLQITHAGLRADTSLTGQIPLGPSEVESLSPSPCREMSFNDIQRVVEAFGQAARRAKEAGFDGLQIHAAHGYLLSQFLSPVFNRRTDQYGGSVQNRARALLEVLEHVRAAVGTEFPVLVKMNCEDFLDGGFTLGDSLEVGVVLQKAGIDALELSGGTPLSGKFGPSRMRITSEQQEAYFREQAKAFKEKLSIPLILVGGIRTFDLAERLVGEGQADYISLCRPLIREPELIKRWAYGDLQRATCISCNRCFKPARAGEGIYCVVEKREKERQQEGS
jgi:2,4-dienoyl-CoA reductase-like NADH-dependent reductase (Old Yellow Enzyme family)